jgi:hypothetical protein
MNQTRKSYININTSFKRKVVFRIGLHAGFFSEYNNMILAMAWCLKNKYQFQIFSSNANFGFDKGWTDYFVPFCTEVYKEFHLKFNHRPYPYGAIIFEPFVVRVMKKIGLWETKYDYTPLYHRLLKKFEFGKLLTQDIFVKARTQSTYADIEIPELGFKDNLRSLCKLLTEMTWVFNNDTQMEIDNLIKELDLPPKYIGFHIRGGDKFMEFPLVDYKSYIEKAETLSEIRNAFVLTDDYRIIIELKKSYPNWNFHTLCQSQEIGYYYNEFKHSSAKEKRDSHIRLFASMLILELACHFIGTFSSNPGMFLGMRMLPEFCHGVDYNDWQIW